MTDKNETRIGYYVERTDAKKGEKAASFILKAHDPNAQRDFERLLREGTKRRREQGREGAR